MLRQLLLKLASSSLLKRFVVSFPLAKRVARRFVAGETLSDALAAARELREQGLLVSLDLLGENVDSPDGAARAAADYARIVEALVATNLKSNVSLKLTQLGLDLGIDVCLSNLFTILEQARQAEIFVRIDMEGSEYTERTMQVFEQARAQFENVGIVIQSYLFRCEDDVRRANACGGQVRLCKGAYSEKAEIAFQARELVNRSFIGAMKLLLDDGKYPGIATHDEAMIAATLDYVKEKNIPTEAFEFQMLYGIRRERQLELLREGYKVRVYVPYGTEWYPYFMRRLAERPANLLFFLTALFRG